MDTSVQNTNTETQITSTVTIDSETKKILTYYWLKYPLLILLMTVFLGSTAGYYYATSQTTNANAEIVLTPPTPPTENTNPQPTLTPVINYNTYLNNIYGFTIFYPSLALNAVNCNKDMTPSFGMSPTRVFEDNDNSTFYISFAKTALVSNTSVPGQGLVPSKCTVQNVDINLLRNQYSLTGHKENTPLLTALAIRYTYKRVLNDSDLRDLAGSVYGKSCGYIKKKMLNLNQGLYKIEVVDEYGSNTNPASCYTNYSYDFYYSVKNQVAITGNIMQNCSWPLVDGQYCGTKIEFQNIR